MKQSRNGFGMEVVAAASDRRPADIEYRQLISTFKSFIEALRRAVDAFELINQSQPEPGDFYELVSEFEANLIREALRKTNGQQKRAAQILGLRATTLNSKMKRLKLSQKPNAFAPSNHFGAAVQ